MVFSCGIVVFKKKSMEEGEQEITIEIICNILLRKTFECWVHVVLVMCHWCLKLKHIVWGCECVCVCVWSVCIPGYWAITFPALLPSQMKVHWNASVLFFSLLCTCWRVTWLTCCGLHRSGAPQRPCKTWSKDAEVEMSQGCVGLEECECL